MATYADFQYGRSDECAAALRKLVWPNAVDHSDTLAYRLGAMLWLDSYFGKDDPSNVIWLERDMWGDFCLYLTFVDAELQDLSAQIGTAPVGSSLRLQLQRDLVKRMCSSTFQMQFIRPNADEGDPDYPDWLQGQVRTFQLFTDSEEEIWPVMYTARADGTKITLS